MSEDGRQLLAIAEILKAGVLKHTGLKFRQHVNIAVVRVKIIAQYGTEKAELADASFLAETGNLLPVNESSITLRA